LYTKMQVLVSEVSKRAKSGAYCIEGIRPIATWASSMASAISINTRIISIVHISHYRRGWTLINAGSIQSFVVVRTNSAILHADLNDGICVLPKYKTGWHTSLCCILSKVSLRALSYTSMSCGIGKGSPVRSRWTVQNASPSSIIGIVIRARRALLDAEIGRVI